MGTGIRIGVIIGGWLVVVIVIAVRVGESRERWVVQGLEILRLVLVVLLVLKVGLTFAGARSEFGVDLTLLSFIGGGLGVGGGGGGDG